MEVLFIPMNGLLVCQQDYKRTTAQITGKKKAKDTCIKLNS